MLTRPLRIETARLRLRPFTMDDVATHQRLIYGDPDVVKTLPTGKPWPIEDTRKVIAWWIAHQSRHQFAPWVVTDKESGAYLGHCGLMYVPRMLDDTVELIYALGKEYWGQGYAKEAARAALRYGFETIKLDRIIALAMPENAASRYVMEKIGMTYEGTDDKYYDARLARCIMTRDEFVPDDSPYTVR
jgi:RimJ/RimL family protein N-acetyltransferase